MAQIADLYAGGLSLNNCAKRMGIAPRTLHSWLKLSREDDPSTMVTYLDNEVQLCQAMEMARQILYMNMRSNFEARMATGFDETPIYFQGRPQFVEDERCLNFTPDEREAYGFERDGILRDSRGRRVREVLRTPVPVAGVLASLAMAYDEWTPKSKSESTVTYVKTQGVTVVPAPTAPPTIPERPKIPELEVLPEPQATDGDLTDLLGPDLVEPDIVDVINSEPEFTAVEIVPAPVEQPPVMIREPAPAAYQPTETTRPLNPQLQALLNRRSS